MINIDDPRTIPQSEMPLIVLSNQTNSWIAKLINFRTNIKGDHPYDHAMVCIDAGKFVCQDFSGYHEIPMDKYLIKGGQLAFVELVNSNPAFVEAFRASVLNRLAGPWWTKMYDFLGIFGQAIGQPWIHTPGLRYCSVDDIRHLVNSCPRLPKPDQMLINNIPPETNPEAFWDLILKHQTIFNVKYTWDSEVGIVV